MPNRRVQTLSHSVSFVLRQQAGEQRQRHCKYNFIVNLELILLWLFYRWICIYFCLTVLQSILIFKFDSISLSCTTLVRTESLLIFIELQLNYLKKLKISILKYQSIATETFPIQNTSPKKPISISDLKIPSFFDAFQTLNLVTGFNTFL